MLFSFYCMGSWRQSFANACFAFVWNPINPFCNHASDRLTIGMHWDYCSHNASIWVSWHQLTMNHWYIGILCIFIFNHQYCPLDIQCLISQETKPHLVLCHVARCHHHPETSAACCRELPAAPGAGEPSERDGATAAGRRAEKKKEEIHLKIIEIHYNYWIWLE